MHSIRQGSRIRIDAPAKLNLFLELHGRRDDGYHELETVMSPISLYDTLIATPRDDSEIQLSCEWVPGYQHFGDLPVAQNNLAYKALDLLRQRAGITTGADIILKKRIPAQAGMGGGSSDAAAALVAGTQVWNLDWTRERLALLAGEIGSDVPFFLFNSLARCTGRGEVIEPMDANGRIFVVVVKPPIGLSTADVFRQAELPASSTSSGSLMDALHDFNISKLGSRMFNRLQGAASKLDPWINKIAHTMQQAGVCGHQMSGSGTSYFAVCRNRWHARQVAVRLRATKLGTVFAAHTLGPYPVH